MNHKKLDFNIFNKLFRYCPISGSIFNRVNRGTKAKAGAIATSRSGDGYLQINFVNNGCLVNRKAHRIAWLLHTGEDPGNKQIDHIDRDKTNNRFSNLRLVNNQNNNMNKSKPKNNTSGIVGVYWRKDRDKWEVKINEEGELQYLGIFEDKFEAICARKSAERKLGYHENHGK